MCSRSREEVLSVVLMTLLGVTALFVEFSAGEVKLGVMPPTSLYRINDFDHYDVTAYQKFLRH